jgi:hypothetical protein
MMTYIIGTIVVVFGIIMLMIFLALHSVSGQPVDTQTPTDPPERKWSKYFGLGVFALAAMYLWWKFILSKLSVEWGGWVPEFSLDTVAIIVILVGLGVWWNKKEDATTQSGTSTQVPKETSPMIKFIIAGVLGVLAWTMYQYQIEHLDEVVKSVPKGYFYLPIHGLLFAGAMMGIAMISLSWDIGIFVIIGYYLLLIAGMFNGWFAPHQKVDPLISVSFFVSGLVILASFLFILKNSREKESYEEEYFVFFCITTIAVFLPQLFL